MNRKSFFWSCVILLACCSSGVSQNTAPEFSLPDLPCGNPIEHSDIYFTPDEYGNTVVTKVLNGNTVLVTLSNGKRKVIKLGGVVAPGIKTEAGKISLKYLSELVLNKRVEILLYGSDLKDKVVGGRISLEAAPFDVNLAMLESGMGRYGSIEHLTSYDKCKYQIAAEEARKKKKGLWEEQLP
jgi:endonuclease YncB( thermonuclease family)